MPSITLTVLITAIVVVKSPITVDSSPPPRYPDRSRSRDRSEDHPNNPPTTSPPRPPPPPTRLVPPIGSSLPSPDPNLSETRSTHPGSKQPTRKVNLGRKIGLLFVGMAGLLQVAVVGFLGFRRWQISNIKEDSPP
ncbi:hypothetical protein AAC387_Pa03g2773 [Persea americana]